MNINEKKINYYWKKNYFLWQQPFIKTFKNKIQLNSFKTSELLEKKKRNFKQNYNSKKIIQKYIFKNIYLKNCLFPLYYSNFYKNLFLNITSKNWKENFLSLSKIKKYKYFIYNKYFKKTQKQNTTLLQNLYFLTKKFWFQDFERSNQNTYFLERPISYPLQWIQKGDLLADCSSSNKGELALGKNLLVAYMSWEGFNFEDAVLINNSILFKYTSLHIEKYDLEILNNINEQITRDIPSASLLELQKLDKNGIIKIGTWVEEGDILIGKTIFIDQQQNLITYEKLLYDIMGQKKTNLREQCLKVPQGVFGRIIRISYNYFKTKEKKFSKDFKSKKKKLQKIKQKYKNKILLEQKSKLIFYRFPKYIYNLQSYYLNFKYNFCKNVYFYIVYFKNFLNYNINLKKKNNLSNRIFSNLLQYHIKKIYRWFCFYNSKKLFLDFNIKKEIYFINPKNYNRNFFLKNKLKNQFKIKNYQFIFYLKKNVHINSQTQKNLNLYIQKNLFFYLLNYNKKRNLLKQKSSLKLKKNLSNLIFDNKNTNLNSLTSSIKKVTIYIAEQRKFQVGDKISGRHGNKGIISQILPNYDMPYLSNGATLEVLLNPLGVPSRMNVGQILECLLGFVGKIFHTKFQILCFDEIYGYEASRSFIYSKLYEIRQKTTQRWLLSKINPGKLHLFDGRTGELFNQPIMIGYTYLMKLIHIVDEKIHARSTGPYSLITQQPVRGRSKQGGQRLGEMEVWALQGYGCAYTLQELLTSKSDDIQGRNQILQTLLKNESFYFGTPESLRVVLRELQCLCLDIQIYY